MRKTQTKYQDPVFSYYKKYLEKERVTFYAIGLIYGQIKLFYSKPNEDKEIQVKDSDTKGFAVSTFHLSTVSGYRLYCGLINGNISILDIQYKNMKFQRAELKNICFDLKDTVKSLDRGISFLTLDPTGKHLIYANFSKELIIRSSKNYQLVHRLDLNQEIDCSSNQLINTSYGFTIHGVFGLSKLKLPVLLTAQIINQFIAKKKDTWELQLKIREEAQQNASIKDYRKYTAINYDQSGIVAGSLHGHVMLFSYKKDGLSCQLTIAVKLVSSLGNQSMVYHFDLSHNQMVIFSRHFYFIAKRKFLQPFKKKKEYRTKYKYKVNKYGHLRIQGDRKSIVRVQTWEPMVQDFVATDEEVSKHKSKIVTQQL